MSQLECVPVAVAACLRNSILNNVRTFAIDRVTVLHNTSVLHNEFVASRMALCPIIAEYPCSGTIDITYSGPGEDSLMNITSGHLRFDDDDTKCVHDDIVIAKLAPGQRFCATFTTAKGTGAVHTKFCPVSVCYFKTHPSTPPNSFPEDEIVDVYFENIGQLTDEEILKQAFKDLVQQLRSICPIAEESMEPSYTTSPTYQPTSPTYQPTSPTYQPTSPT